MKNVIIALLAILFMQATVYSGSCSVNCESCTLSGVCKKCTNNKLLATNRLSCVDACGAGETVFLDRRVCIPTYPGKSQASGLPLINYFVWLFQTYMDIKDNNDTPPTKRPKCMCKLCLKAATIEVPTKDQIDYVYSDFDISQGGYVGGDEFIEKMEYYNPTRPHDAAQFQ